MMKPRTLLTVPLAILWLSVVQPATALAQLDPDTESSLAALEREFPELNELLLTLERAHGILYGRLIAEGDAVRASGTDMPTFDFEFDMFDELVWMAEDLSGGEALDDQAKAGYAALGDRAAEVITRTHAFHRELLAIYADPEVTERAEWSRAVDAAVARYLSRPEVALPAEPKDMDILYDHTYTWAFRTGYPDLGGFIWAAHWLQLASLEPVMTFRDRDARLEGLATVTERFFRKLSYGEPPDAFPTELPLAPPIAPGLVAQHPRAAAILDNLNMMHDVLADILVSHEVEDVHVAIDEAVSQFLDPGYRVVTRQNWILMALRHSIFNQGGPALGVMTSSERNAGGHAQHLQGGGPVIPPGM